MKEVQKQLVLETVNSYDPIHLIRLWNFFVNVFIGEWVHFSMIYLHEGY